MKEKSRGLKFAEAIGDGLGTPFAKLGSEIFKDGALSSKDKAIIAVACAVAVKCEYCAKNAKRKRIDGRC
jgi:alkylhydroperoxidase/carboxymuconolactone decarboxylase family protein YurZ